MRTALLTILGVGAVIGFIALAQGQTGNSTPPNPIPTGGWLNPDPTFNYPIGVVDPSGHIDLTNIPVCTFSRPPSYDQFPRGTWVLYFSVDSKTHQTCKI